MLLALENLAQQAYRLEDLVTQIEKVLRVSGGFGSETLA